MAEGEEKAAWEGTDIGECQFKNDLTYLEDSQGAAPPHPGPEQGVLGGKL